MIRREVSFFAKLAQTAAVFIVVSVMSLVLLSKATPLDWEDHFRIGQNLRSTGDLTIDGVPSIFRPPGYPVFVAATLWIGDRISPPQSGLNQRSTERDQRIVVSAHGILLGAMAAVLFLWASSWSGLIVAAGLAVTATLNPFSLALANVATYHLLFVVLLTFSTVGLLLSRAAARSSAPGFFGAGLLWGLTSLVKPVALLIPFFITPLMLMRWPLRPALKSIILIGVGMMLIISPYVVRNTLVTGQPFVTAQGGVVFWGSSIEKMGPDESFLEWQPIWWKYGMPVFSKVTGAAEYSNAAQNTYALQLNAEFWKQARQNIVAAPSIYLYNVWRNLVSFNLDTMEFWNKFFVAHNKRLVHTLSGIWIVSLMLLSAAGLIWGCIKNEDAAFTVFAVYLCIVVAHSISFATELYTVSKFPLIVLGFALLVRRLESMPRYGGLARATAGGMAGLGLIISVLAA
jgi:hypothetical protein